MKKLFAYIAASLLILGVWAPFAHATPTKAATLYVGPATATYTVGSTFTVSFYVDTGGQFINVVNADILFPADKIQVVSPSTGASFINVWAIQPSYSNTEGTISFRGAVPSPGISTSAGLISTVTFRVKSVGTAAIRFGNGSKVLLNDGLGTNVLQQSQSGIYELVLPPPAGPVVGSQTHPDQTSWYSNDTVSFSWTADGATGYSYMMNSAPVDIPDAISEGSRSSVTYESVSNGRRYFHIKALRAGAWGGTTHYAVNIDTEPPAAFPIDIIPSARTAQHQPVVQFFTTDADSGLDHYEMKFIPLSGESTDPRQQAKQEIRLYTETASPYIPGYLDFGRYDVYIRAYDIAGNYREVNRRLEIVPRLFEVVQGQGIGFSNVLFIPWSVFWGLGLLLLLILGLVARRMHWWHRSIDETRTKGALPDDVAEKLRQLKSYQQKYGKVVAVFLAVMVLSGVLGRPVARAQDSVLPPPVITTVSKDIFADEIFYVGGRTAQPGAEIIMYMQALENGQTSSYRMTSDDDGAWFYRHNGFTQSGSYVIWAQAQRGEELSPPSPQVTMTVATHAIQLGTSRFSYEAVYFVAMVLLGLIVIILTIAVWYHYYHGRRKHSHFLQEKAKIEESVRRGFALLRRDIEEEISLLRRAQGGAQLSGAELAREEQLLKDLDVVRRQVGEEVWELGKIEEGY